MSERIYAVLLSLRLEKGEDIFTSLQVVDILDGDPKLAAIEKLESIIGMTIQRELITKIDLYGPFYQENKSIESEMIDLPNGLPEEAANVLRSFCGNFAKNYKAALNSGNYEKSEYTELAKATLNLTAFRAAPRTRRHIELTNELDYLV